MGRSLRSCQECRGLKRKPPLKALKEFSKTFSHAQAPRTRDCWWAAERLRLLGPRTPGAGGGRIR